MLLEAAWIVTNITTGNSQHCDEIVKYGGIPLFIELLRNDEKEVVEHAIWTIGNLVG